MRRVHGAKVTRLFLSFRSAFFLLASLICALPAMDAGAAELPMRRAGLWETKMLNTGSPIPSMKVQHCIDEATDKQMSTAFSPISKEVCSRIDVRQTATGYATDSTCTVEAASMTSHSDIIGDFNSAYRVRTVSQGKAGSAGASHGSTTTIEAKWLGACKPGQKPGDTVMPGGIKLNTKDLNKLKALLPK
jgi:hypothetical protein